jgi:hypothetical protein
MRVVKSAPNHRIIIFVHPAINRPTTFNQTTTANEKANSLKITLFFIGQIPIQFIDVLILVFAASQIPQEMRTLVFFNDFEERPIVDNRLDKMASLASITSFGLSKDPILNVLN